MPLHLCTLQRLRVPARETETDVVDLITCGDMDVRTALTLRFADLLPTCGTVTLCAVTCGHDASPSVTCLLLLQGERGADVCFLTWWKVPQPAAVHAASRAGTLYGRAQHNLPCGPAGRAVVSVPGGKQAHSGELHNDGVAAPRLAVPSARHRRPRQQVVQVSKGALQDVVEAVQVDLAEQHACVASSS